MEVGGGASSSARLSMREALREAKQLCEAGILSHAKVFNAAKGKILLDRGIITEAVFRRYQDALCRAVAGAGHNPTAREACVSLADGGSVQMGSVSGGGVLVESADGCSGQVEVVVDDDEQQGETRADVVTQGAGGNDLSPGPKPQVSCKKL